MKDNARMNHRLGIVMSWLVWLTTSQHMTGVAVAFTSSCVTSRSSSRTLDDPRSLESSSSSSRSPWLQSTSYSMTRRRQRRQKISSAVSTTTGARATRIVRNAVAGTINDDEPKSTKTTTKTPKESYDVLIVGSGIGGLSCAAMLSLYGYSVAVLEAHYAPGGCAHGYTVPLPSTSSTSSTSSSVYTFDTGPSFFSGLNPSIPPKSSNPLRTVLDAIGEEVPCIPYTTFGLSFPEGNFLHSTNFAKPGGTLDQITRIDSSPTTPTTTDDDDAAAAATAATTQWNNLMKRMEPLAAAVEAMPAAALRQDIGVALTASKFLPNFAKLNPLQNLKLTQPFSTILAEASITDPKSFTKRWLDLLCFCLSGLPTEGTITAEMAMMMGEFYEEGSVMDCPVGGAKGVVDALVRGVEKRGGDIFLNAEVEEITVEGGRATGVVLKKKKGGRKEIRATKAVVSNLSVWDLYASGIVDSNAFSEDYIASKKATPAGKSFMHLHIGFRATKEELANLQAHYMYVDDWERGVEAEDNAALLSIPSVHDETLAPDGHATLHIYTPATEEYARWEGLKRNSPAYDKLKEERSQYLWYVLEKIIPDIRQRAEVIQVGTPLTHQRFLRRYRGSYGPAIVAGEGSFPFPGTPVKGLLCCGDSCFPGIGVPAVAGSGILAANSVDLDSLRPQLKVLDMLINQGSSGGD